MARREIVHHGQYFLLTQGFQKMSAADASAFGKGLTCYFKTLFNCKPLKKSIANLKGEKEA